MLQDKITDIFFDLDHTLWDFDKNSELAFEKIFTQKSIPVSISEFVSVYAPINQACWKLYQVDKITHEELRYNRLKQSFDTLNFAVSDEIINQISIDYIEFLPENNALFQDALEVLDYLSLKYRLHIITNGFEEVQYKKINNSGIAKYFQTITNSEMAGVKKPNPIIFEYALQKASTQKEKSIMIGDCLDADVGGALNFGMEAIFFNDKKVVVSEEIKQINQLIELKNIL